MFPLQGCGRIRVHWDPGSDVADREKWLIGIQNVPLENRLVSYCVLMRCVGLRDTDDRLETESEAERGGWSRLCPPAECTRGQCPHPPASSAISRSPSSPLVSASSWAAGKDGGWGVEPSCDAQAWGPLEAPWVAPAGPSPSLTQGGGTWGRSGVCPLPSAGGCQGV